ncbi:MAG: hypothetical protein DIJKHBIC_02790 [Thermoanaerobaculia bacterium]|nr:hypothetical protein [Thermoanaerobaculia bacterium]
MPASSRRTNRMPSLSPFVKVEKRRGHISAAKPHLAMPSSSVERIPPQGTGWRSLLDPRRSRGGSNGFRTRHGDEELAGGRPASRRHHPHGASALSLVLGGRGAGRAAPLKIRRSGLHLACRSGGPCPWSRAGSWGARRLLTDGIRETGESMSFDRGDHPNQNPGHGSSRPGSSQALHAGTPEFHLNVKGEG